MFGEEGLDRLLALRTADQAAAYLAEIGDAASLKARLAALAAIREREGYMAEVREDAEGLLLLEHHCPVCAAARLCTGLCREELALFAQVLGDGRAGRAHLPHPRRRRPMRVSGASLPFVGRADRVAVRWGGPKRLLR